MSGESEELERRIRNLSDDELLKIVSLDYGDYRQEALDFAAAELERRNLKFVRVPAADESSKTQAPSADESPEAREARRAEKKANRRAFVAATIIVTALAVLADIAAYDEYSLVHRLNSRGVTIDCLTYDTECGGWVNTGQYSCNTKYSFTVGGKEYTGKATTDGSVGELCRYDPVDPSWNELIGADKGFRIVVMFLLAIGLTVAAFFAWRALFYVPRG
jgi:hypothetical protein